MDFKDLPKAYDAGAAEADIFRKWEDSGAFDPDRLVDLDGRYKDAEPYCIVLPPPNRTGTLHIGHAKMLAIEDLLIRFYRMCGRKAYWIPGTDHAAISTQVKVEQLLIKQGIKDPRRELGREKFLEKVREYAEKSRDTIVTQCKAMGSSMDWKREKYTLDEERNKAVNAMFKMMHEDGLIERDYRLVNWDPVFRTTLSDDEVFHKETQAEFVTFTYDKDFPIRISTTRPETKFGDTAVAVHPDDVRYREFVGQTLDAVFCGKQIKVKVIADKEVDPDFGTGALGVTPAHSMIDADMAMRHGLPMVQVIGMDGRMTAEAGTEYAGLTTIEARKKIVGQIEESGCLIKKETVAQNLAVAERGGNPVEQLPMLQWWVRVNKPFELRQNTLGKWKKGERATLKELMRHAVESGQTRILPDNFEKIYFHWIDNLRDWCVSRQILFGHQVPVWYKGEELAVGSESPGEGWERDPDTLDTWFSSGMWTFSTLGWPDNVSVDADGDLVKTGEMADYHPTAVLETGYDILFFWVARMVLMSAYALGEVPFRDVYLHGLVRDEQGRKMSKSLDNVLDPLDLTPKYGTDAVRLALIMGTSPGMDQKLSEDKIKDFRNFTNKLWNIARYILQSTVIPSDETGPSEKTLADRWIMGRSREVQDRVTKLVQDYQFSQAGDLLRDFTWGDFADWYLEVAKIEKGKDAILRHILSQLMALWHPYMPFVTEYVWKQMGEEQQLIVSEWPMPTNDGTVTTDSRDTADFESLRTLISDIRRLRSEQGVEPAAFVDVAIVADDGYRGLIEGNIAVVKQLARIGKMDFADSIAQGWATAVSGNATVGLDVAGTVDVEKEKEKIQKEIDALRPYISSTEAKLQNVEFTSKAPVKVVQGMKDKLEEAKAKFNALEQRLTGM